MSTELIPTEPQELAIQPGADPVLKMIQKVIDGGVTESNVMAVDKLLGVYERLEQRDAEKQFAAAFIKLQAEMPRITADKEVPDREGNIKYKFAPYETIMDAVQPLLQKYGFTVTFSMTFEEGRVIQTCTLQHIGGHSKSNQFACRVGQGPPKSSEAQGDGAASTYAKRFALCNALNITIESDTDAQLDVRLEGDLISSDKVQYLKEQVKEVGYKEESFLKLAGVDSFDAIREGSYGVLTRAIEMKRNANKKAP